MPARQPVHTTHQPANLGAASRARAAAARPAKRTKRDGSPKVRWTAEQRSERGRPPRRSSGRDFERAEGAARPPRGPSRREFEDDRSTEGADRASRTTSGRPFERSAEGAARPARRSPDRQFESRTEGWARPARRSSDRSFESRNEGAARPLRHGSERQFESGPTQRSGRPAPSVSVRAASAAAAPAASAVVQPSRPARSFAELGLPAALVAELSALGITEAFPIQAATIPDALRGRDVLGRARTGSGKTLAFALPILARLTGRRDSAPGSMILVPTRELAMQACDVIAPLARAVGLQVVLVAGGMPYGPQLRAFERGTDIVVATPGRLIDLLERGAADLSRVEVAVLDEADHMADLGFTPEVRALLDAIPGGGQRLLFSATLDRAVDALVRDYLADPVTHEVDSGRASIETMAHHVVHVLPKDKAGVTAELAARDGRTVVFARSQLGVERTAEELRAAGILAGALHGGLGQGQRNRVLAAFRTGQLPVLVATDVAARGIHVDDVSLVVQADPPNGPKEYLHRAGRTARAGADGVVVTLVLPHQRRTVARLAADAGIASEPVRAEPGDRALARATGARIPSGEPVSAAAYERLIAPPARSTRSPGRGGRRYADRSGPRNHRNR